MNKTRSPLFALSISFTLILSACMAAPAQPSELQPAVITEILIAPTSIAQKTPQDQALPVAVGWNLEMVAQGLEIPWSIVFPDEGRILVSERTGAIRQIVDGALQPKPVYFFEEVRARGEAGLMGLALHPQYDSNAYLYACYAAAGTSLNIITRIARLIDDRDSLSFDRVILDNIPAANNHAGCRIKFGPDGMLYISTGDALDKSLPQDINSLAGKILRVTPEGLVPADNPFPGSPVYSIGHRNPQGLDWDLSSGRMYSSEHGPSTFDGPPGGDEINLIVPGGNYGWPLGSHDNVPEGTIAPLIQFTPAEAPASALFYNSDILPFFTGSLFFGALRGEGLVRVVFSSSAAGEVSIESVEKIIDDVGRVREAAVGPDGSIYFTTSNRDGRGTLRDGDDKIFRMYPVYNE